MRYDQKYGVSEFNVITDLPVHVAPVCAIALSKHHAATHYKTVDYDDGSTALYLFWAKGPDRYNTAELPFPLQKSDGMAHFILQWLNSKAVYGEDCFAGGDGDSYEGVRLTNTSSHNDIDDTYLVMVVEPTWVYYGK